MRLREAKAWLSKKGVRDLEPVPLNCDQLNKVSYFLNPLFIRPYSPRKPSRRSRSWQTISPRTKTPTHSRRPSSKAFHAKPFFYQPMRNIGCLRSLSRWAIVSRWSRNRAAFIWL